MPFTPHYNILWWEKFWCSFHRWRFLEGQWLPASHKEDRIGVWAEPAPLHSCLLHTRHAWVRRAEPWEGGRHWDLCDVPSWMTFQIVTPYPGHPVCTHPWRNIFHNLSFSFPQSFNLTKLFSLYIFSWEFRYCKTFYLNLRAGSFSHFLLPPIKQNKKQNPCRLNVLRIRGITKSKRPCSVMLVPPLLSIRVHPQAGSILLPDHIPSEHPCPSADRFYSTAWPPSVIRKYTWDLYNLINQCRPNKCN